MKNHNLFKRCFCLLLSCLLVFTTLSNDVRRVEATSIVVGGSILSVIGDILFGVGLTFAGLDSLKNVVSSFSEYTTTKKSELELSPEKKTTIHYKSDGTAAGGAGKSFDLKIDDLASAEALLNGTTSVSSGMEIPLGVLNALRAFSAEKLNISALDGSVPSTSISLTPSEYYDAYYTRLGSFFGLDGQLRLYSSGTVWIASGYLSQQHFYYLWGTPGLTVLQYDSHTLEERILYTFPAATSPFLYPFLSTCYNQLIPYFNYSNNHFPLLKSTRDFETESFSVPVKFSNPSIDLNWANAPVTWDGVLDDALTLTNQAAAKSDVQRKDYVASNIKPGVVVINKDGYNSLKYILALLAIKFGATSVPSSINDIFIGNLYNTHVQGTAAEKYEQSDSLLNKFTVIEGTGGNNNKNFKVLNVLVNAYLACLMKYALVPSSTPQLAPNTQIENVIVKDAMTDPDPLPKPTVSPTNAPTDAPTNAPTDAPNPDLDPGINVLDWLSKIFNAIVSVPTKIVTAVKAIPAALTLEITKVGEWIKAIPSTFTTQFNNIKEWINALPSTFASSQFGQWLKSIPGILTDIGADIKNMPSTLIDIKNSIVGLPDLFITKIKTFFTIDHVQVDASVQGVTSAFTGKFSALKQITDVFDKQNYTFSNTIPVIKMQTPDVFKPAIKTEQIIILDLRPYKDIFAWCRLLLTAFLWVAFGKWVIDQFDVDFHIG